MRGRLAGLGKTSLLGLLPAILVCNLGCSGDPFKSEIEQVLHESYLTGAYFAMPVGEVNSNDFWHAEFHYLMDFNGRLDVMGAGSGEITQFPLDYDQRLHAILEKLKAAGYISYTILPVGEVGALVPPPGPEQAFHRGRIEIAEKGKGVFTHYKGNIWRALMCDQELLGIANLARDPDGTTGRVEFRWRYGRLTPVGEIVYPVSHIWDHDLKSAKYDAMRLRKDGDAWRPRKMGDPLP